MPAWPARRHDSRCDRQHAVGESAVSVLNWVPTFKASICKRHAFVASLRQWRLRYASLPNREREVFRHLLDGLTSREIGTLLALSPRTVEVHRAHVHEKLHVRNTIQLACEYKELLG